MKLSLKLNIPFAICINVEGWFYVHGERVKVSCCSEPQSKCCQTIFM